MNIILISSVLNYRTLAGASSKHRVYYLLPEQNLGQLDLEFKELDGLSGVHRKNLIVHPLKRIFVVNAFLKALELVKSEDIDLFWTTSPILGLICLFFKLFYRKPYAIFVGQPFTEYIRWERPFYYRLFIPFYKLLMLISFWNADVITTHSRFLQEYVKRYGGRRVVGTYYYGVDTETFRPLEAESQEKFTIMYAGRFSMQKGVKYLADALVILKRRGMDFKVWMYGRGPLKDYVSEAATKNGLDVEINDYVDQSTLAKMINRSNVFVVPSVSEGLGFLAAEALSCGIPVVASRVGGLPDSVEGYGILVPPKDSGAIADAIAKVHDNYNEYRKRALDGRKHIIDKFERKKVILEFQNAMESVVGK